MKLRGGNYNVNVLNQLAARREQCFEHLLNGQIQLPTEEDFGLSNSSPNIDQLQLTGANLVLRRIQPEQPINPGELVHIIKYDQLNQQLPPLTSAAVESAVYISENQPDTN